MRTPVKAALLLGTVAWVGCNGGNQQQDAPKKLDLTAEQIEEIKQQDDFIQNEEGGPQKITKPTKKGAGR
jgi:hypothetical protein